MAMWEKYLFLVLFGAQFLATGGKECMDDDEDEDIVKEAIEEEEDGFLSNAKTYFSDGWESVVNTLKCQVIHKVGIKMGKMFLLAFNGDEVVSLV